MSERFVRHTEPYDDHETALSYYAGLRCLGMPSRYVTITRDEPEGPSVITMYSDKPDGHPVGFPSHDERMGARLQSYRNSTERLGTSLLSIAGWQCQPVIRYSNRAEDYVFSADIVPLKNDIAYDKKLATIQKMLKDLYRETGVQAVTTPGVFGPEHPLHQYATAGISYEFPLAPNFLKLERCRTLDRYDTPPTRAVVRS